MIRLRNIETHTCGLSGNQPSLKLMYSEEDGHMDKTKVMLGRQKYECPKAKSVVSYNLQI